MKGEAQKSSLIWRFVFDFLRSACSIGFQLENPLNLIKSPIFTNTPCKFTCLYHAPSLHTVDVGNSREAQDYVENEGESDHSLENVEK